MAVWRTADDGIHCRDRISIAVVVAVVVVVVVVSVFGRSVFRSSFRGFLGSSESEFFFDLEFVVKNYFKINPSFVRV